MIGRLLGDFNHVIAVCRIFRQMCHFDCVLRDWYDAFCSIEYTEADLRHPEQPTEVPGVEAHPLTAFPSVSGTGRHWPTPDGQDNNQNENQQQHQQAHRVIFDGNKSGVTQSYRRDNAKYNYGRLLIDSGQAQ